MAEPLQPTQVAQAVVPVRADTEEFRRQIDEELEKLSQKFSEATDAMQRGLRDKVLGVMDEILAKVDEIKSRAGDIKLADDPRAEEAKKDDAHPVPQLESLRDVIQKLDDTNAKIDNIDTNIATIAARMGNV